MQRKFDSNFDVLLISVDASYGGNLKKARGQALKIFEKAKVKWPNVFEPNGWEGVQRNFNLTGYGLTLVGPDGVVLGIDLHATEVEKKLTKLYGKPKKQAESSTSAPAEK